MRRPRAWAAWPKMPPLGKNALRPLVDRALAIGAGKVGDDGERLPMDVSVGDKVLVGKYSGSDIKIDGEDYVILREDEILAIVER